jgi:Protein of unknown function (DUF3800)
MLTVYCDESGTDAKNRVAVVAGYIGQVSEWRQFEKEWKLILKKKPYRVTMMHRADLETWHGEFTKERGWDPNRRGVFLSELQPIIKSHTKIAVGTAIIKEDWENAMPEWLKRFFGGVYGWCAHACLVATRVWCDRPNRQYKHPINWVFESGTSEGVGEVMEMFRQLRNDPEMRKEFRIGRLSFSGKAVMPLQAADVLAYEVFKQVENQVVDEGKKPDGSKRDVRISIRELMRPDDMHYLQYWNMARLREWIADAEQKGVLAHLREILG